MSNQEFPPLLLRNGGVHKNLCSLNSILQLLRHIPEFLTELTEWKNSSPLLNELSRILSKTGQNELVSAKEVRNLLVGMRHLFLKCIAHSL